MATANTPADTVQLSYDDAGRVLSVVDGSGSRVYTYEPVRKRLSQVTTTYSALPTTPFTVTYAYFPDGSVQSVTSNVAGQWSYAYDKAGQLTSLTNPQGTVTSYAYDHIGRLTSQYSNHTEEDPDFGFINLQHVASSAFSYGNSGQAGDTSQAPAQLKQITHQIGLSATPYTLNLTHSYLGQLIGQTVTSETGSVLSAFSYGYDGRGRLTAETQAASAGNGLTAGYTYDLSNNVRPTVQAGWSFNASNQLTNTAASGAGLSGGTGIGYDASGNVSAVDGQTLSWDGWGRLTGVGSGITYAYDSAGRRMDFPRKSVQSVKQVGSCGILF